MGGLVVIEPPILSEGVPPDLVVALRAGRMVMNILARIGVIRLMGKYSMMRLLTGGATPPAEFSEHTGFLYRPQVIQAAMDEISAIQESIKLVNETAKPNGWRNLPVVILAAQKGEALPETLAKAL